MSPLSKEILVETFSPKFNLPNLDKYDGLLIQKVIWLFLELQCNCKKFCVVLRLSFYLDSFDSKILLNLLHLNQNLLSVPLKGSHRTCVRLGKARVCFYRITFHVSILKQYRLKFWIMRFLMKQSRRKLVTSNLWIY